MKKNYIIYCDESVKDGRYYSNFYGGVLIEEKHREFIEEKLQQVKDKQNIFNGELKWTKITENYEEKYKAFIETYFNLMKKGYIKTRIMFSNNSTPPNLSYDPLLSRSQIEAERYFKLYYQFLKHGFGLIYHPDNEEVIVSLLLDRVPHEQKAFARFKSFIHDLENVREFRGKSIFFPKDQIINIDSKKHIILQALDINLGAMNFRLNELHKAKPSGEWRRAKRTMAKERIYKFINKKIREIYPHFNIGISTGKQGDIANRWHHTYRHWEFTPASAESTLRIAKSKR